MFFYETDGFLEEFSDFRFLFALEEFRAGRHQRLHHPNAVLADTALGLGDLPLCFGPVFPFGLNKMEVEVAPAGVHIGITGVLLLGTLIVGLDVADLRPLVLGEAENGVLRFQYYLPLLCCQTRSNPNTSAS